MRTINEVSREPLIEVLQQAGWVAAQGRGKNIAIGKGAKRMSLPPTIPPAHWRAIEAQIGAEVEGLLDKGMRGRGRGLTEEELKKRLGIAASLWRAQAPAAFIMAHTGLTNAGTLPGFKPRLFDEIGFDGVVAQYTKNAPSAATREVLAELHVATEALQRLEARLATVLNSGA